MMIYLDNNATTQPAPQAVEAMLPFLTEWYSNPSSVHRFGQRARQAIDEARARIATLVHCAETELQFTGGGTEAINTAIRGLLAGRSPRKRIVTTAVEHSATRELCAQLAKEGAEIIEIPVDVAGTLDLDALRDAVTDETALVTIMWANNETGVLFPVDKIAEICRGKRVPFHCDGTQAVGKIAVNVAEAGIDAMSFASHKFHGPKGVGALFVRRGIRIRPLLIGGPQERGRRGGTENVPGIVGMGIAAELAAASLPEMARVAALRDRLEASILSQISSARVNGRTDLRLPNTTNIGFSRLEAEAILLLLSERGVCASAGAACSSGSLEPSHVLRAMQIEEKIAHGAIRFSLSRYTTDAEIDRALEILPGVITRLQAVLPVGAQ
ncbi:MAG TPA: aminotransferase class V-fold PLP-dependent enzyme [Tepidisphaeraceae bacterium]|jgi:cysteine desulfurase|nr:aminotransferase class V-fold PLP-dependent enzyme [Tepidisphaeraceae bacterium]